MKFKQVGNVTINGSMVVGQPVVGGTPDWILYIDNAGNLFGDNLATRDSTTNETHIGQNDGTHVSELVVINTDGLGNWASGIVRNAVVGNETATWAAINGAAVASPDTAVLFADFGDASGNITTTIIGDSTGVVVGHDDITSNTGILFIDANSGAFVRFNDANTTNTFDNEFFITPTGIGWADLLGGTTFFLPTIDGNNGDVLTTDGAGNTSFQPPSVSIGSTVVGGTPKEVLYISNTGTITSDASFYRDSVTHDTAYSNNIMEAGYSVGVVMDDTIVPNTLVLSYFDGINTKGTFMSLRKDRYTNRLRDNTVPGFAPDAGMDINFTLGTKQNRFFYEDSSTPNKMTELLVRQNDGVLRHYFNLSGSLSNDIILDDTMVQWTTGVYGTNSIALQFDYTNQIFAFGDLSADSSQISFELDNPNRSIQFGDLAQVNNGLVFIYNDVNEAIDFGDPGGISGGMVFALRNAAGGVRQVAFGSLSGTDGVRFILDGNNRTVTFGDMTGLVNGTILDLDDPAQSFQVVTNNQLMAHVVGNANTPVSFGWKALTSTNGTGNSAFGALAGQLIDTANDNTAIGNSALTANTGGHSNTAVGAGALSVLNDSGGSDAEYNSALGRQAGRGITTGSYNVLLGYDTGTTVLTTGQYNILIGNSATVDDGGAISRVAIGATAIATENYQVMFGGTGSPFSEFVLGGNLSQSGFAGHDVLVRMINSQGTNIAGGDLTFRPGLATGNAIVGDLIFQSSIAGASGTTLQTASTWGRISQRRVRFGDLDSVGGGTYIDVNDTAGNLNVVLNGPNLIQFNTNDRIHLNGSQRIKRTAVNNSDYTILPSDYAVTFENLSADRTATVPDASTSFAGREYIIKNKAGNTFNVICDPLGTDTIDGAASLTLLPGESIIIISDGGTDWEIVG